MCRGSLYGILHSPAVPLTWLQVVALCLGAAKGMAHLHACNCLHRDLKTGARSPGCNCQAQSFPAHASALLTSGACDAGNLLVDDAWQVGLDLCSCAHGSRQHEHPEAMLLCRSRLPILAWRVPWRQQAA